MSHPLVTTVNVADYTTLGVQGSNATVIIPRGGQGQGKTTSANKLKEELESAGLRVGIFSTDSIFMNAKGEYEFVPFAIGAAHAFLQQEMILSMRMREYDVYILDNTNLQRWEYLWLVREAMLEHMTVFVWDLRKGPRYKNVHGVPEDKVTMLLETSDKPYPLHIEKYYDKNMDFYDWISHTFDHTAGSSSALKYAVLSDRGVPSE